MSRSLPFPSPSQLVRSAGALVWRFAHSGREYIPGQKINRNDIEVLLVHRPRYRDWSWPKGKIKSNEPLPVAAVREVEEETGKIIALGAPLTTQRYRLGRTQTKEVYYWVGTVLDAQGEHADPGALSRKLVQAASKREIDAVKWVDTETGHKLLTRRGDRHLLTELVSRAEAGTIITSTVGLLRHAKAQPRKNNPGNEAGRQLTRFGVCQALDTVNILSAFNINHVISSPWQRCMQTVGPYVSVSGCDSTTVEALTEFKMAESPEQGVEVIENLIRTSNQRTIVCVHRPTVEALLEPLHARLQGSSATWDRVKPDPFQTAGIILAHIARTEDTPIIAMETHTSIHQNSHILRA